MSIGGEVRTARVNRNLTIREVCRSVGVSVATGSRLERGVLEHIDVMLLARMCAVVGLDLSVKAYPGGEPIRDAAHLGLLRDFHALLHPSVDWATEVPLPTAGDPRAWDGFARGEDWRYGVEAETAPNDGQAMLRRLALKQRDGRVDGVLLVLRDTRQTRAFLREIEGLVGSTFPVAGPRALELLGVGADPGGSAIIVLPRRPGSRVAWIVTPGARMAPRAHNVRIMGRRRRDRLQNVHPEQRGPSARRVGRRMGRTLPGVQQARLNRLRVPRCVLRVQTLLPVHAVSPDDGIRLRTGGARRLGRGTGGARRPSARSPTPGSP